MIGDKIYKFRKKMNLSQEEFANSIGVTRQIVSKWESNQSIPMVDKLKKISDVYNIPYDELLSGTDYEFKNNKFNIKKYGLLFIIMIVIQVVFILIVSTISGRNMKINYNCLGVQTYEVLKIYDSEDDNYSYITLKRDDNIVTEKISKVISSMIVENGMYKFIFRSNNENSDIDYIFLNNEIINVVKTSEYVNVIDCK